VQAALYRPCKQLSTVALCVGLGSLTAVQPPPGTQALGTARPAVRQTELGKRIEMARRLIRPSLAATAYEARLARNVLRSLDVAADELSSGVDD